MNLDKRGLLIGLWLMIRGMKMTIMMMMMMNEYLKVFVPWVFHAHTVIIMVMIVVMMMTCVIV